MDKAPEVTILIPTRFESRYIIELCLQTIRKYTSVPYKIIVGNAGVDPETEQFLKEQTDITVVICPDPMRPKVFLVTQVNTPFFIIMHDDVQILKPLWLEKRLAYMKRNPKIGVMGVLSTNYTYGIKKYLNFSVLNKRFFPLGMMVRTETQKELELFWGKVSGFDNGGIAYLQFLKQKKWLFKKWKFNEDILHWGGLTWVVRKKKYDKSSSLNLSPFLKKREQVVGMIKKILKEGTY